MSRWPSSTSARCRVGKFFASAERLGARAQGVVRVDERRQTVTSFDPTDARKATVQRFFRSDRRAQLSPESGQTVRESKVKTTVVRSSRFAGRWPTHRRNTEAQ